MAKKKAKKLEPTVYRPEAREILGIAERTFAQRVADGVIVPTKPGRGRRKATFNLKVIVPAYIDYVSTQKPSADRDARAKRELSQASLNELRLAREQGELVSRDQVQLEGQHFAKAWAAKVRSLPRQLVQAGLVMRDQEVGVASICRELLDEIASWRTVADAAKAMKADGG